MNGKTRYLCTVALFAVLLSSGHQDEKEEFPRDVQWVQSSIEYRLLCQQTYRRAWERVKTRARSLETDWAVVLDVDMTVLDNSKFQEELRRENRQFPYRWNEYVRDAHSPPVPGAVTFVDSVRSLGEHAHIVYITNRSEKHEEATRNNLMSAGLWNEGDLLLCQQHWTNRTDTKVTRRYEVMSGTGRCEGMGKRVLVALIGDQLEDIIDYPSDLSHEEMMRNYSHPGNLGEDLFLLPNPMYGKWMNEYR